MRRWIGVLVLAIATTAFAGRTDLASVVNEYRAGRTPQARRDAVERLAECTSAQTVKVLDEIARRDADVGVRAAAVAVLATREEVVTDARLLELAVDGGPSEFRVACARALAARPGSVDRIRDVLDSRRSTQMDRLRMVETLGDIPTLDAFGVLLTTAGSDEAVVRSAALRAIAVHEIGRAEIGDMLLDTLGRFRDLETVVTVLDVVEDHAIDRWPDYEPFVEERTEPAIEEAVITLRERHAFIETMRLAAKKEAEGYALDVGERPREPQTRSRIDIVYAFDATGSTVGQIDQVKRFITDHAGPLVMVRRDVRVGIVAYRVREGRASARTATEILPLTHDVNAAIRFVDGIDQRGADSQGAAVADAVATSLDRMPWRRNARRSVYLLADGRIDDRPRAWRIARQHHEADRTQLSVWYWANTRERRPEDLERLAEKGGGTFTIADPAPTFVPGTGGAPRGGR